MQGEFCGLALTFPFSRDPRTFKDKLSETFPPFLNCTIGPHMNMRNKAIDEFHCHFPFNELYEKLFVLLWIFMVFLIFVGIVYMSLIFFMSFTPFCKLLFWTRLGRPKLKGSKETIFNSLDIGDIFCLYVVKQLVSEMQFCRILEELEVVLNKHANLLGGICADDKNLNANEHDKSLFSEVCLPSAPVSANLQTSDYKICRQRPISEGDIFV